MQNGKTFLIVVVAILFFLISFKGCFNSNNRSQGEYYQEAKVEYEKTPVDVLIRDLSAENNFAIILYDMDYDETADKYKHQYNVLVERPDTVLTQTTDWVAVSPTFFNSNVDNMGMEIASKKDGKLTKEAAPAGYSNYIGNEKYGQWKQNSSGGSFWEFYGKYAFMSSMFHMAMFPVRYSYWNDYRSNYYGSGRSYYGNYNGRNTYGTNSDYNRNNKTSSWNNKSSDFKSNVRSKVSRSTASSSRVKRSSSSRVNRSSSTKRSRSSSRYSSSRTRSRGGSFGK